MLIQQVEDTRVEIVEIRASSARNPAWRLQIHRHRLAFNNRSVPQRPV